MVGYPRVGAARNEDIARLHVAVDQSLRVRGVQRSRYLLDHIGHPLRRETPLRVDQRLEVGAVHVAHRDEQDSILLAGL